MLHTNLPKNTYSDLNKWLAEQQDCDDYNELNWFRPEYVKKKSNSKKSS